MRSTPYLSTSQTAQMLGLSVGTIQRMVESGALQAYTTEGGHRRILAASVRSYCQSRGMALAPELTAPHQVCIIHGPNMPEGLRQSLQMLPQVHLVSHPLELAGIGEDEFAFFVDAHVQWLDWSNLHRPQTLAPAARWIVYNSADLPMEQQTALSEQVQLYPAPLSAELLQGFLLGVGMPQTCRAPASAAH